MDNTLIFHNDFMIAALVDILSCRELYSYRQTTKYLYNCLSDNMISQKLGKIIDGKIRDIVGDKYNEFMDLVTINKCSLTGEWLFEAFCGDIHSSIIISTLYDNANLEYNVHEYFCMDAFGYANRLLYGKIMLYIYRNYPKQWDQILGITADVMKGTNYVYQFHIKKMAYKREVTDFSEDEY